MNLIRNMILVEARDEENHGLLINTLTGIINVLSFEEINCIKKWSKDGVITCETGQENELIEELKSDV